MLKIFESIAKLIEDVRQRRIESHIDPEWLEAFRKANWKHFSDYPDEFDTEFDDGFDSVN